MISEESSIHKQLETSLKDDMIDYNSEEDSDYIPEEDEDLPEDIDDYSELDDDESNDDDVTVSDHDSVDLDKHVSSSSSSVSSGSEKKKQIEEKPILYVHEKFGDFIHKHEIPRKFLHVSIGFFTLWFYTLDSDTKIFIPYLSSACAIIFGLDTIRFNWKSFNKAYCATVGFLMREKEIDSYNGVIWYLLGLSIAFQLFSKDIGVMAVLLLSWSDVAASTVGRAYGHLTPKLSKSKSLAGSLAAFVVGVASCWIFYGYFVPTYQFTKGIMWSPESSYLNLPSFSVACGFIAALSEGIDILNWDDNFTIPTLSGLFLHCLVKAVDINNYQTH